MYLASFAPRHSNACGCMKGLVAFTLETIKSSSYVRIFARLRFGFVPAKLEEPAPDSYQPDSVKDQNGREE